MCSSGLLAAGAKFEVLETICITERTYIETRLIIIDHFTVVCLVAWPLNESEAGGDLILIETSLLFSC